MKNQTKTTKPPMAKAIREFVSAIHFPPTKPSSDANFKLAGLVIAMLQFANGIPDQATSICVSPSAEQLAGVLHCSKSTIERLIRKLRECGLLTQQRRGRISTLNTIHSTPQQLKDYPSPQLLTGQEHARPVNSGSSTRQLDPVVPSTPDFVPSTVDTLWGKSSGVPSLDKNSLDSNSVLGPEILKVLPGQKSESAYDRVRRLRSSQAGAR